MKRSPMPPRRKRMSQTSARRQLQTAQRAEVRAAVFDRDRHRCVLADVDEAGGCYGRLSVHHRRKAAQGGGYTMANLVTLCVHHNDQIEADADLAALARRLGLVLRAGD